MGEAQEAVRHSVGTVTASDGVPLGFVRVGSGSGSDSVPPLLLVHGGVTAHQCFEPIAPLLAERRQVVAYDRRGRGLSGDGDASIEREALDVVEMAVAVGGGRPVDVLGYSYGGMLAIHALRHADAPFRKLVVYEPPFAVPGIPPPGLANDVIALLEQGEQDEALRTFLRRMFQLPEQVVAAMERHPMWQVSLSTAPTIPREFAVVSEASIPADVRADVPVLVLVAGEGGNDGFREAAARLSQALPDVRVEHVGGIPHFAIAQQPADFTARVERFLGTA